MVTFDSKNKRSMTIEKEIAMEKRHTINGDDVQAILGQHLSSKPDRSWDSRLE
jgi:hypothetical protein